MNIVILKSIILKGFTSLKTTWATALPFFISCQILEVVASWGGAVKVLSIIVTAVLGVATFVIGLRQRKAANEKMKIELQEAEAEQMFALINRFMELGWIEEGFTDEDLQKAIKRFNNIKDKNDEKS